MAPHTKGSREEARDEDDEDVGDTKFYFINVRVTTTDLV